MSGDTWAGGAAELAPVEIGKLRLLRERIYDDVWVGPGEFAVFLKGAEISWVVTGERVSPARVEISGICDGMFAMVRTPPKRTGIAAEHRVVMNLKTFFDWIPTPEFTDRFVWIPKC